MYKKKYTIVAAVIALMFWFFDATIHYFVYGEAQFELIPGDFNELWMRAVIVILLLILGIYADVTTGNLIIREKQLEAYRIHASMAHASRHILNNLLNQMQIIKIEALRTKDFDRDILKYYDDMFNEAQDLIQRLSEVESITDEEIWASVAPVDKKKSENGGGGRVINPPPPDHDAVAVINVSLHSQNSAVLWNMRVGSAIR